MKDQTPNQEPTPSEEDAAKVEKLAVFMAKECLPKAPDYGEIANALRCLAYAYGSRQVRDGLRMIGLGHEVTNYIDGRAYSSDDAYEVLARLEDRLGEHKSADNLRNRRGQW